MKESYQLIADSARVVRQHLKKILEQELREVAQWEAISRGAAFLAFLLLLGGICAMFAGITNAGLVTLAASVVTGITSALFFKQAKTAAIRVAVTCDKVLDVEASLINHSKSEDW